MGKPSQSELQQAIRTAIKMRESDQDPDFVAKTLLNQNYRLQKLERLLETTRRFLHAGQSVTDRRQLLKVLEEAEKAAADPDTQDLPLLGRDN
ncbi:MAG: hypothetical protein REI12_11745 [Pedobacter sp.]|nr:hypothetical protein [Pedobacter sp.]